MILKALVAFDINFVTVILSSIIEPIPGVSVYDAGHEMQSDDVNQTERFINNCIQRYGKFFFGTVITKSCVNFDL